MTIKQIEGYTVYLSQILGRGSYGNVYKGFNEETQQPVAIKIIPREKVDHDEYLKAALKNEIQILQAVESEYIVGFYDVMESSKNYYIIQELCEGDLSSIIKRGQHLPEAYCITILTQLCQGFLGLVREGIIHRDLKPANIMKRGNIFKIGDFGFSKQHSIHMGSLKKIEDIKMKTTVGTPLYMSIEILKSQQYTSKCDIWALGIIFYELLHGQTPWTASRQFELVNNIQNIPLKIKRDDLSVQTIDFLNKCLQVREKERISWNEVFIHPIFANKFLTMADENKEYENKMKGIMTKLRFYFNLNRQNLEQYLDKYGFINKNEELSFQKYFEFLKAVNPSITQDQAVYIFKKTDLDNNGCISLDQIICMLQKYGIGIDSKLTKTQSNMNNLKEQKRLTQEKVIRCFSKLYKILLKNQLTLKKVFDQFDKQKKGSLSYPQFKVMIQKLSKDISDQQAFEAFNQMDDDDSGTLQYEEISRHFKQTNGIESQQFK